MYIIRVAINNWKKIILFILKIQTNQLKMQTNQLKFLGIYICLASGIIVDSRLTIRYSKNINTLITKQGLPFICGAIFILTLCILSPLILIDDIFNLCIIDRQIDNIQKNYNIELKRYHQHGINTIYYSNSRFVLNISKKWIKNF